MHSARRRFAVPALIACALTATACSSTEEHPSGETPAATAAGETAAGETAAAPGTRPADLPSFWDGQEGGLFKFFANSPAISDNGVLVAMKDAMKPAVIWSWNGQPTPLTPKIDADEIAATSANTVYRDGQWYLVQTTKATTKVAADSLGEAKSRNFVTTWNDKGETVFQGEYTDPEGYGYWPGTHGQIRWAANAAGQLSTTDSSDKTYLLDPFTGKITSGEAPEADGETLTSNAISVHQAPLAEDVTVTNRRSGASWSFKIADHECRSESVRGTNVPRPVVSSFDGRYIAFGPTVIDTKSMSWACLDPAGNPTLDVITSTGIGYGAGKQNGKEVVISYDFASSKIAVISDAAIAPTYLGPDDQAVVEDADDKTRFDVYATK